MINPYDPCVANNMVEGSQLTAIWNVDDMKISHTSETVIKDTVECFRDKYERVEGNLNSKMQVNEGKVYNFLGMTIEYQEGGFKFNMEHYIRNLVEELPDVRKSKAISTPSTLTLVTVRDESPSLDV